MSIIRDIFDLLFRRDKDTARRYRNTRHEPPAISQTIDASRLSDILRQAEAGDMDDFFSLARDVVAGHGHTLTEFGKRKLAVLGNAQSINPENDESSLEVVIATTIGRTLRDMPSWHTSMVHLLDSTLYPVSVVEKEWVASHRPGWRFELKALIPVPYRLFDFTTGCLRIRDVGPNGELLGTSHEVDELRYIVHRGHLLTSTPDTWGGPLRAILFWWLFAVMDRDWWARFLERFGAPFLEGTYNKDDDSSRYQLEAAFSAATRLFGIAVPDDASVKIHQANTSQGGDAFEQFQSFANREISKIVLGQTSSSEGTPGKLGNDQGQENVRDDIRQYDARTLSLTINTQVLAQLCRLNGWPVPTPQISWGGDDIEELDLTGDLLKSLRDAGIRVTDKGIETLSKRLAIPLERDTAPPAAVRPGLGALSALASPEPVQAAEHRSDQARDATDQIAESTAPTLSDELAAALQPLAAAVNASTSISDLEARLRAALPKLDMRSAAAVAEGALVACSANGAIGARTL